MAMTKVNLDLGRKPGEGIRSLNDVDLDETIYPSFHYSTTYDLMGEDFPTKGTMTIEYEITRSVETKVPGEPDRYDCDVDVKKIVAVDGKISPPATSGSNAEDALDALAKALHEKLESESEEGDEDKNGAENSDSEGY